MAALITVYSQPATFQAAQLNTYSDMADALNYLLGLGYTGNISAGANKTWQLWFQNASQNVSSTAFMGDWVVIKNNSTATSVPAAQAGSLYTTTPPA